MPEQIAETVIRCSMCAYEFAENSSEGSCGKCALFSGCRYIPCPRCGYEMPRTPGLVKMVRRWAARRAARRGVELPPEMPLANLGTGGWAVVLTVATSSEHERSKLMALGLLPGALLRLSQRFPSYVVRIGHTELALDKETARQITVRPQRTGQTGGDPVRAVVSEDAVSLTSSATRCPDERP